MPEDTLEVTILSPMRQRWAAEGTEQSAKNGDRITPFSHRCLR